MQARPGDATGSVNQGQVDPASGRLRDQGALAYADGDSSDRVRVEAFALSSVQASAGVDLDATAGKALREALAAALEFGTPADGTLPWTFALDELKLLVLPITVPEATVVELCWMLVTLKPAAPSVAEAPARSSPPRGASVWETVPATTPPRPTRTWW